MSTALEEQVKRLESRLRELEDHLAIYQLIATYGPAVDSGSSELVGSLWSDDASYDTFPVVLRGRSEIEAMVVGERHQGYMANGCAHVQGMPYVVVAGDTAVAILYSQLFLRDEQEDGFRLWRVAANRWEFARDENGWRITSRVNKLLDGSGDARDLLGRGVKESAAG